MCCWISCVAGFVRATHTWLASRLLSTLRSTLRPLRSLVLTSQPGPGPPYTPTNYSSTHTSAYGVRRDGRVLRDHSALAQLCGFVPPKLSKMCTYCVKESARDSEPLFNMIAHLGHPGARDYVQVLAVFSVSSGNPGAIELTLYSSFLFNMIVHLVNTGAREIVKSTVVNSVASGIPDAMEPTLYSPFLFNMIVHLVNTGAREIVKSNVVNSVASGISDAMEPTLYSSFLFNMIVHLVNTGAREIVKSPVASGNPDAMEPSLSSSMAEHVPSHLSPLKSNNGSSHLQVTSHYKATPPPLARPHTGLSNFRQPLTKTQYFRSSIGLSIFLRRPFT